MGTPFSDITLYTPTLHAVGTPEYWEETSLKNYVSDLYVRKMNGYKPPKTTRITIQPEYHGIWNRTWKNGSIIAIAPYFSIEEFQALNKRAKYQYILDLIQTATLELCEEYKWDKNVFENAYNEVIRADFTFKLDYPKKISKDKLKSAKLTIEKTETITTVYATIQRAESTIKMKLFDKKNVWWYDCAYIIARHSKWFDTNRFGISYGKRQLEVYYSIAQDEVSLFENGSSVSKIDFHKFFLFG